MVTGKPMEMQSETGEVRIRQEGAQSVAVPETHVDACPRMVMLQCVNNVGHEA